MAFPKTPKIVLTSDDYKALQQACFRLDKWRCRVCGKIRPLQLHHMQPRSKGRLDTVDNCISLCPHDHERVTRNEITIEWNNVQERTVIITVNR